MTRVTEIPMKPLDDVKFTKAVDQINSEATREALRMIQAKIEHIALVLDAHTGRLDDLEDAQETISDGDITEEEEGEAG